MGNQFYPLTQVLRTSKAITGASKANPGVVTAVAHGFATGDEVYIAAVGGMVEINNLAFTVTVLTADTFSIGVNTSGYTTYTSGGVAYQRTGTLTRYNAGDIEGAIPLLEAGGKFNAARIPATASAGSGGLQKEGATKTLSGLGIAAEWTGLSDVVRRMHLVFGGMSFTGGTFAPYIAIGAGSYTASGYWGCAGHFNSQTTANPSATFTTDARLIQAAAGSDSTFGGEAVLTNIGSHKWRIAGSIEWGVASPINRGSFGYVVTLGAAVDRIKLALTGGTFDAGTAALFTDQSEG